MLISQHARTRSHCKHDAIIVLHNECCFRTKSVPVNLESGLVVSIVAYKTNSCTATPRSAPSPPRPAHVCVMLMMLRMVQHSIVRGTCGQGRYVMAHGVRAIVGFVGVYRIVPCRFLQCHMFKTRMVHANTHIHTHMRGTRAVIDIGSCYLHMHSSHFGISREEDDMFRTVNIDIDVLT